MKKIFITRQIPNIGIEMLRQKGYEIDVWPKDRSMSQKELLRALGKKQYDAVLCLLTDKIDAKVFDSAPSVKMYANYAAGFNNIDVNEAKKRGIAFANIPAVSSRAVAEHTVTLMLTVATRVVEADNFIRKGKYKGWEPMHFLGADISGKTVGLIGVGNIGSETAKIMNKGFNAKIIYYDVTQNKDIESSCGAIRKSTVEELIPEADFISLHVPLLDSTYHLMNKSRLEMMKPTAFIINTSRGPAIDEKALVEALKNKKLAGAGLDVFESEPKLVSGLAKLPNVVLTPHIASARQSVRNEMSRVAAQNIIDFLS